jgi:hypothetical protein
VYGWEETTSGKATGEQKRSCESASDWTVDGCCRAPRASRVGEVPPLHAPRAPTRRRGTEVDHHTRRALSSLNRILVEVDVELSETN